jgi:uncharacterized protein (TIGR03085 family)
VTGPARIERLALADLMTELGPDAPTLCEGWTTRDLTAHLILRERHPIAAAGIAFLRLQERTARHQAKVARRDFTSLLHDLRRPPVWSLLSNPLLDEAVNVNEMFVHHEDVRRAQPGWTQRTLSMPLQTELFGRVRKTARLFLRKLPLSVVLDAPRFGVIEAGGGGPAVKVTGDPAELALFIYGRQRVAEVEITGDPAGVERLRKARLGV